MKVTGKIQKFQDEGNIHTGMGSGFGRQDRDGVVHESERLRNNSDNLDRGGANGGQTKLPKREDR